MAYERNRSKFHYLYKVELIKTGLTQKEMARQLTLIANDSTFKLSQVQISRWMNDKASIGSEWWPAIEVLRSGQALVQPLEHAVPMTVKQQIASAKRKGLRDLSAKYVKVLKMLGIPQITIASCLRVPSSLVSYWFAGKINIAPKHYDRIKELYYNLHSQNSNKIS